MSEENKAVIRKLAEAFNSHDIRAFENVYTPELTYHGTGELAEADRNSFVQFVATIFGGIPDARLAIDELLTDGDKVTYRITFQGTHTAELMGIPATNKKVTVKSIGIAVIAGDRIAEEWEIMDELGLMQQLGAIPQPG